jgi:hypothetical protein
VIETFLGNLYINRNGFQGKPQTIPKLIAIRMVEPKRFQHSSADSSYYTLRSISQALRRDIAMSLIYLYLIINGFQGMTQPVRK